MNESAYFAFKFMVDSEIDVQTTSTEGLTIQRESYVQIKEQIGMTKKRLSVCRFVRFSLSNLNL